MSSFEEQERDPEYRLSSTQVNDFHKRYKWLGGEFERWLGDQAVKNGWKRPISTKPKKKWSEKLRSSKAKATSARWRDPEDRRSLSIITLEKYAQFQDHRVFHLTSQGEFIKGLQIEPPEKMVENLEQCISLRKKVNRHFENLPEDKIHPSITPEEHRVANTKHKFFIDILEELLSMLVPQPNNDPVDPDQALRQEIAGRMRGVLRDMYNMTEGVMNAWERYFSNQLSLSQATLITHAAVERSQVLEKKFRDGQNQEEQQFIQQHFADYDPKHIMDAKDNVGLDLHWDLRVLLDGRFSPPRSNAFEESMEIFHFPTIYVLSNFQVMSEWWNHEYPVPGYPVSLENVVNEKCKKELSKAEIALREENKTLKSQYRDQIKIIWKFLNEILFIHKNQLGGEEQATVFGTLQGLPGETEDKKIFLPADIFSKALSDVIRKPGEISMSTSYAIQLLAKISLRFQHLLKNSADPKSFSFRKDIANKASNAYNDQNLSEFRDQVEPLRRRIYNSYLDESLLWANKRSAGGLNSSFEFEFFENAVAYLNVADSDGQFISKYHLPVRSHAPRLHEVDAFFFGMEKKCDVTWHANTTEFYFNTQPLYAGTLELARTLAEYRTDLAYANYTLSIFAMGHLRQAPAVPPMIENFLLSPKVNAAIDQQQDWIPANFKATSVEDVLNLIKDKIRKSGSLRGLVSRSLDELASKGEEIQSVFRHNYEAINGGAMMNSARPVEILWRIIALNEPISISTFLGNLAVYFQTAFGPKTTPKLSKNKSKATSSFTQSAVRPGPSGSRSWEKDVEIVEKYWEVLPWSDTDDNFLLTATQCNTSLATLGDSKGLQMDKEESIQSFNLRVLHTFLCLWKVIEKENEKRGEPFGKEDEDKIKDNMADQYKDAKTRQQGSGKRKSGGSSREHLARSDKRRKF